MGEIETTVPGSSGSSIDSVTKTQLIQKFRAHDKDCGSSEVQIALWTQRLKSISGHFSKHPKDLRSQRGMLQLISKRKRLLSYLQKQDAKRYRGLISELGLRK